MPLGRKTPIGKPGWGSMLSVVDGGLTSIPWEDLDPTLVQARDEVHPGMAWRIKMHSCHTVECITSFAFCFVLCFTCV